MCVHDGFRAKRRAISRLPTDEKAPAAQTQGRRKPLILVTNDDGIEAPGLAALGLAMMELGNVVIIAPKEEQSAVGHAITLHRAVHAIPHKFEGALAAVRSIAIDGTPADCVKLALNSLLDRRPDLVASGINRGSNMAINVMYSGTVSAATESSIRGVDSMAFSLVEGEAGDYEAAARYAQAIGRKVLRSRLPRGIVLNVNVPPLPYDQIKGISVTRLARARYEESFVERTNASNHTSFWYKGKFFNLDGGPDTDVHAVEAGYVSISPIQHDLTAHGCLGVLGTWRWAEHML